MSTKLILYLIGLLLVLTTSYEMDGDVIVLTDQDDFPAVIEQFPYLLIEIYAPWCGHCKKLAPAYTAAATALKQSSSPIKLAKVDATKNPQLSKRHGVRGYPSLFFYVQGGFIKFKGGRTKEGIIDWVTKKIQPQVIQLDSQAYNALKTSKKQVSVILFSIDEAQRKQFKHLALADEYNKYYFAPTDLIKKPLTVQLIRNFDSQITFTGDWKNLQSWIDIESRPKLLPFDQRTSNVVFSEPNKRTLLFINTKDDRSKGVHEIFEKLAQKGAKNIIFSEIIKGAQLFDKVVGYMKLSLTQSRVIIIENGSKKKFVLPGQITQSKIQSFLQAYQSGKAVQYELKIQDEFVQPQVQAKEQKPTNTEQQL